jgi:virulence-associated protein VagC
MQMGSRAPISRLVNTRPVSAFTVYTKGYMPISTKTFLNGRSTAVRIPAEFGIKPGEELLVSQDEDGTVRLSRARPFASYFAALERMKAEGRDPAKEPFEVPKSGPPR